MAHGGMKLFFVYLHNNTDERDDEVVKVRARTKNRALAVVEPQTRENFTVGSVMTGKGLKRFDAEWHALLWGQKPQYEEREHDR